MQEAVQHRLLSLARFGVCDRADDESGSRVTYQYKGTCPRTGAALSLPRTVLAEAVAQGLSHQLAEEDAIRSKMYGILLVDTPAGCRVLKAFSGRPHGRFDPSWVPAVPQNDQLVLSELQAIAELEAIRQKLWALAQLPDREEHRLRAQDFAGRLARLAERHRQQKERRRQRRQQMEQQLAGPFSGDRSDLANALTDLDDESRRDGIERRQLKRERDRLLKPLKQTIESADAEAQALKHRRRWLSRQLQAQMHAAHTLTNFAGERLALSDIVSGQRIPTGTGDCCAPKLLHYAAAHGLKPMAMAEFWWGDPSADGSRISRTFYGACAERCQPIMGFLLSGMPAAEPAAPQHQIHVLYEDRWLVAVHKPAGLLSTPGRAVLNPNNAASQVRDAVAAPVYGVHRLDQGTSGVLLFARSPQMHRQISDQFRQRRVEKRYEALVTAPVMADQGSIHLPIGRYQDHRPKRRVDRAGKPSHTQFAVLQRGDVTRLDLTPTTGRTHQLRVHLAAPEGLGAPILGDRLYGGAPSSRLHLHARELTVWHPELNKTLCVTAETPF
ncbi:MAG: RluA family pseudouridine synthase [Elainellaceae cyanobacterium]